MNMKITIKKILITLGGIITLITVLLALIEKDFSIANAIGYFFEKLLFVFTLEPQSILTVIGPLLIIIGLFLDIKDENMVNDEIYTKKKIIKYKILRIVGILPFIGVICYGIFYMFNGSCFFYNCSYGINALFETIFLSSIILWPLYIIGIVLIIINTVKLKQIEKK